MGYNAVKTGKYCRCRPI